MRIRTAGAVPVARRLPLVLGRTTNQHRDEAAQAMKPTTVAAHATGTRPNRILIVLAATWMILSLAIGGSVTADSRESTTVDSFSSVTTDQTWGAPSRGR